MLSTTELVDAAETLERPFEATYKHAETGREIKCLIQPGIVTADFLEGLDALSRDEKRRRLLAQTRAAAGVNRKTRRSSAKRSVQAAAEAEGLPLAEAVTTPDDGSEETALASRARQLRFMARTCGLAVVDWNLGERPAPDAALVKVEPTEAYFLTKGLDWLGPFFEWLAFEAGAPKKTTSETSVASS